MNVDIQSQVNGFFGYTCITELIFRFVDIAIIGSGIMLLVYLVWGAFEWLTSGGDKGKIENSRSRIMNALIGVALVALAFAIWKLALTFFGIDAPNICSPDPLS